MGSSMLTMLHRMDKDPLIRWAAKTGVGGLFTQMDRHQKSGRKKEGEHGSWVLGYYRNWRVNMIKMLQKHEILKDLIKIFSKIVLKDKKKYDEK